MPGIGFVAAALAVSLFATPAFAYIGPGAGITVLGALWGVVVALVMSLGAVLMWPIRGLFRRRRRAAGRMPADAALGAAAPAPGTGDRTQTPNPAE